MTAAILFRGQKIIGFAEEHHSFAEEFFVMVELTIEESDATCFGGAEIFDLLGNALFCGYLPGGRDESGLKRSKGNER